MCRGLLATSAVEVSAIVLNNGRLADGLRTAGVDVTVIDEQHFPWWQVLWRLTRHFRARPVDILHTHRYKENVLGSIAAKVSGIPHVVRTVHGTMEIYTGWKWVKCKIYKVVDFLACLFCVGGLIGVSKEITEGLQSIFPRKSVVYIPNCIDEKRLVITQDRDVKREELGLKASEFVIGTVGRLTPVKGTEYLIRAVPEIIKHYEGVRILIVGDGPLRADLEVLTQSLGLEKTVIFLGWRDDTVDILNALDLFVLPSLHEGMPTVLLEAMFLGVPVVASATGGIPEVIVHGWNGLLMTPGSESSIANNCLSIAFDTFLANTLMTNGIQESNKYHIDVTVVSLLKQYQR